MYFTHLKALSSLLWLQAYFRHWRFPTSSQFQRWPLPWNFHTVRHQVSFCLDDPCLMLYLNRMLLGKVCFLCEDSTKMIDIGRLNTSTCPLCSSEITLDLSQGQRVLEHIGAHILFDSKVKRTSEPCFLCLQPAPLCTFFLTKGKGAWWSPKIDHSCSSGCLMKLTFLYSMAAKSSASSPCSNVPV